MFQTVFPSIIRSLRLYIQHHVYVKTDSADCLLASSQQNLFDKCLMLGGLQIFNTGDSLLCDTIVAAVCTL